MMPLKAKLKRLKPPDVIQSLFNHWVREGFLEAAAWFISERLRLRFEPGATRTFRYARRTIKSMIYKALRRRDFGLAGTMAKLRGKAAMGNRIAPIEDEYSWLDRATARDAAIAGARGEATATSRGAKLVIRIPIGHAIHPKVKGEISRLLTEERVMMRRIAVAHVRKRLRDFRQPTEVRIGA